MKNTLTLFPPRLLLTGLFLLCFGQGFVQTAAAATLSRHALVFGNTAYTNNPLPNPERDAQLIAARLQGLNFQVELVLNASQREMLEAISRFEQRLSAAKGETVSFAYYAGHGVQIDGSNYLLPVDFAGGSEGDARRYGVNADELVRAMDRTRSAVKFLVLDACRDNPFENRWRSLAGGLALMHAPAGTLIAYSTSPGQVALDGNSTNSPYTLALAEALQVPDISAEKVFKRARSRVIESTESRQVPWDNSSLYGEDFYFASQPGGAVSVGTIIADTDPAIQQPAVAVVEPISAELSVDPSNSASTAAQNSAQDTARAIHLLAPGSTNSAIAAPPASSEPTRAPLKPTANNVPTARPGPKRVLIVTEGAQELSPSVLSRINRQFDQQRWELADPYPLAAEQGIRQTSQVNLSQAHRLARASHADYLIHASVRIVGEQDLKFYGRHATQFIAELVINAYDVSAQRQLGQSLSKTVRYTSINALEQGRAAVDELMPSVNQTFALLH